MFFVVAVADGLSARDTAEAVAAGPPCVNAEPGYLSLVEGAGFDLPEIVDVTDDYAATLSASIQARDEELPSLEKLIGTDRFAEGQSSRREELAAVHNGLLRRYLIATARP